MAHEVCSDISSWMDPIRERSRERIRRRCNWWCLCCNKWFWTLVWIVVVAGKWIVETICEIVATIADVVAAVVTAVLAWFVNNFLNPQAINKALGMHIIDNSNEEGGWNGKDPIVLIGNSEEKKYATAFNNAELSDSATYFDSGIRYSYRIDEDGKVFVKAGDNPERLLEPEDDRESRDCGELIAKDPDIADYIAHYTPFYLPHDNKILSGSMFKPDTTIFKAHITVEAQTSSDPVVIVVFEKKIAGSFTRRSRFEYVYEWQRIDSEERHQYEAELLSYCNNSAAGLGTSVWFEDIVGHVATPERTIFEFISS